MIMKDFLAKCWILLCFLIASASAKRNLVATSLVTCMDNSQLTANSFDVVFNPDDSSLHYTLDITTEVNGYVVAQAEVYAYGFRVINKVIDP